MINENSIQNVLNKNIGYCISKLDERDHSFIYNLIKSHFSDILRENDLDSDKINFENYLYSMDQSKHSLILTKKNRIFTKKYYQKIIEQTYLFRSLNNLFRNTIITDEEKLGYGNIYWRLVRPYPHQDVGPFHKDKWGWDLSNLKIDEEIYKRAKIWISIVGEDKLGFRFVKNSIKKKYNFSTKKHSVKTSFSFRNLLFSEKDLSNKDIISLKGDRGTFIMFNDELLHTGEILKNNSVRISIEFTFLIPLKNKKIKLNK